jgi:hypothetical protein
MEPDDILLDNEFDEYEVVLDFVDPDQDVDPEFITNRVSEALEEFTFEEIIQENEKTEQEVLEFCYELGFLGLPEELVYEEVEDREAPED